MKSLYFCKETKGLLFLLYIEPVAAGLTFFSFFFFCLVLSNVYICDSFWLPDLRTLFSSVCSVVCSLVCKREVQAWLLVTVVLMSSVECSGSYFQTSCYDATIEAVLCANQLSRTIVSSDLPLNQRQSTSVYNPTASFLQLCTKHFNRRYCSRDIGRSNVSYQCCTYSFGVAG